MNKQTVMGLAAPLLCLALAAGCSRDQSVAGGTAGTLRNSSGTLRDLRINVDQNGSTEPLAFGVTTDGGRFELYQPDAKGPLHLPLGEYAFTLETIGPEPIHLAPVFRDPQRTPLRKQWDDSQGNLDLAIP